MVTADLDAHCPEQRFRLYRRRGDELECVAACEHDHEVVAMIRDQRDPDAGGTLLDNDAVGLLDSHGFRDENPLDELGNYTLPGAWLIRPWVPTARPRRVGAQKCPRGGTCVRPRRGAAYDDGHCLKCGRDMTGGPH